MVSDGEHSLPSEPSDNVPIIIGDCLEWCCGKQISSSRLPVQHIGNFSNGVTEGMQAS